MTRVRIRSNDAKDPRRKTRLLQLLSENEIYVNRLFAVTDGFTVLTQDETDLDRLFNGITDKFLENNGFKPVLPPELKARRSIIIFNVDSHIHNNSEEMIAEIMDKNAYTNNQITDLMKFPRAKNVKITFTKTSIAKKANEIGLRMFSMSIAPHQIQQDTYIEIKSCMRCYKLEDHISSECTRPAEYKICSECSEEGHTWRECTNTYKRCINCQGDHRTLAMRCQKRKDILNIKRKEGQQNTTYSNMVKKNNTQQPGTTEATTVSPNTHTLIYACFMYAHIINIANPGTFQQEVNKMFKANNLPPIKTPDNPPSQAILNVMSTQANSLVPGMAEGGTASTETNGKEKETRRTEDKAEERANKEQQQETSIMQESIMTQGKRQYQISGEDIGLTIYTKQNEGWPTKVEFTRQVLVKGLQSKKYKYTYTDHELTEEDVIRMIEKKTMDITAHCFAKVDNTTFSKIRAGLIEEKTSPPSKGQRTRKST